MEWHRNGQDERSEVMSVTAAQGFRAAGVAAGLKASGGPDVALVVNEGPLDSVAAVFTANRVKAAPVLWSQQVVSDGHARAVILNSGGANACTGPDGFADTHATAEHIASLLSLGASDVVVCSTGLIGERLPMDKLLAGANQAVSELAPDQGPAAAEAIRTTDSVAKTMVVTHPDGWTVGGMAKGAGMLAPSLATMLCVITTDAVADAAALDDALRAGVRTTFDRIDADGCMSTNDAVILMASGTSGQHPESAELAEAVRAVCADLSRQLLADAEGATKEVEIIVSGAASEDDAVEVGRSIARNNLLKCALFGNDPNWGRVLAAIGTTNAAFDADQLDVAINGVQVCRAGAAGESRDQVDLTGRRIVIEANLNEGSETATVCTNDLSHAYVEENSAYSS
jgi:glutamate N-acetyltransferase/amino-acid N-acetyltransferase